MEQRPLTQDELLAEAARTELDNLRDLEHMVALEEATKKKAMYKRSKYSGPMIRFHSKRVDEVGLVCCRPNVDYICLCAELACNAPSCCHASPISPVSAEIPKALLHSSKHTVSDSNCCCWYGVDHVQTQPLGH